MALNYPHGQVGFNVFRQDSGCEYGKIFVISLILEAVFKVSGRKKGAYVPVYGPFESQKSHIIRPF